MQHVIRIGVGLAFLAMAAGCTPEQRIDARETGQHVAQETREAASDAAEAARDQALAAKVEAALRLRKDLDVRRVEVDADARTGLVALEGSVPTRAQRDLAAEVARTTEGVREVVNRLALPVEEQPTTTR